MLVFSTRIPLKSDVTHEISLRLFIKWVSGSPNYSFSSIDYDVTSREDFNIDGYNASFSIRHYSDEHIKLSACRLENRQENLIWISDCIYLNENEKKSLLVQLHCNTTNFNIQLPDSKKPYIVRKFIEEGCCDSDAGIPVTDTPLLSDSEYFDICADMMMGKSKNNMPVVYISCDYENKIHADANLLARRLGGIAHVFVESSRNTSLRLRTAANGNNVHSSYIGIYFPGTDFCEKFNPKRYDNNLSLCDDIVNAVQKSLVNRLDSATFNWNQILTLQSRQKMLEWKSISQNDRQELSEYIANFDKENSELRQKIEELNRQVQSKSAQLEYMQSSMKNAGNDGGFYKQGSEPELCAGEYNDLLNSILKLVHNRYEKNTRAYVMIQSMLDANPLKGENARIIREVKKLFKTGCRLSGRDKAALERLGFKFIDEQGHIKMIFHDERYMFTLSKTPGDYREGKNIASEICKMLDIDKKINIDF